MDDWREGFGAAGKLLQNHDKDEPAKEKLAGGLPDLN
jgi:hypothetical protein